MTPDIALVAPARRANKRQLSPVRAVLAWLSLAGVFWAVLIALVG
jgi:hypothetical protein